MPKVKAPVESLGEAGEKIEEVVEGAVEAGGDSALVKGLTEANPFGGSSLPEYLNMGIAYAILITGFLSVVFMLVGGVRMIISHGDDEKVKQAVATIRHSVVGLVIAVLAVVLVATVGKAFDMDVMQYIDFDKVMEVVRNIGGGAEEAVETAKESLQ